MAKPMSPFAVLAPSLPVGADAASDVALTEAVFGRLRKDLGNVLGLLCGWTAGATPVLEDAMLKSLDTAASAVMGTPLREPLE